MVSDSDARPGAQPAWLHALVVRFALDADSFLAGICEDLSLRHRAHTILLYGSRADGSANEYSDYDIAAFSGVERTVREAREVDGQFLDLFIYPDAVLGQPTAEYLTLRGSRIIVQRGDEASDFLNRLDAIFDLGPAPLPADELQARRAWAWKMAARMKRGDIEGAYRRTWLLTVLLDDYFHLRGRWYQGPKKSFQWLGQYDPETYRAFEVALAPAASHDSIHELIGRVVGTEDDFPSP